MKPHELIGLEFKKFLAQNGENAFKNLKIFFKRQKEQFYTAKIAKLKKDGINENEAIIKARQGCVSVMGRSLELIVKIIIAEFCVKNDLKITNDKILKGRNLDDELNLVKRAVIVHFGKYAVLPDGDIIIYKFKNNMPKILAILSVKNSFCKRYTETPYWKLKLSESNVTKHIKVFMITPDNDDEISFFSEKKSRIVMEHELDGIYLAKENFDNSDKIKSIENLVADLEKLL